jgi:hypothetical protein
VTVAGRSATTLDRHVRREWIAVAVGFAGVVEADRNAADALGDNRERNAVWRTVIEGPEVRVDGRVSADAGDEVGGVLGYR